MKYVAIALIIILFIFGIYKVCTFIADAITVRSTKKSLKKAEQEKIEMADAIMNVIERQHSPEAYLTYINLKDYPKSRNPFWNNDQLYESIILFIRRTYATCKNITHEEPFIVDTIQFANLVRSELPKDTILSEEVFLCTLEAYASYYLTINEEEIYNNIVKDFNNDDVLVSDIIFKMRQKYIQEFKESWLNGVNDDEMHITPNLAEILAEVFTEKNITPQLQD